MNVNKHMLLCCLFCLFLLSSLFITGCSNTAYAQHNGNNYRHGYNQNDVSVNKSLGKLTGMGALLMLFSSTLPCMLRRITSSKLKLTDNTKNLNNNILKFFKRTHYITGTLALMLAIMHGAIMITGRANGFIIWMGMTSAVLMLVTVLWGASLLMLKKNSSLSIRQTHMVFALLSMLLAIIHLVD